MPWILSKSWAETSGRTSPQHPPESLPEALREFPGSPSSSPTMTAALLNQLRMRVFADRGPAGHRAFYHRPMGMSKRVPDHVNVCRIPIGSTVQDFRRIRIRPAKRKSWQDPIVKIRSSHPQARGRSLLADLKKWSPEPSRLREQGHPGRPRECRARCSFDLRNPEATKKPEASYQLRGTESGEAASC